MLPNSKFIPFETAPKAGGIMIFRYWTPVLQVFPGRKCNNSSVTDHKKSRGEKDLFVSKWSFVIVPEISAEMQKF